MDKQDKIQSLTWKYFWQQKREEMKPIGFRFLMIWYFIGFVLNLINIGIYMDVGDVFLPGGYVIIFILSVVVPLVIIFIQWIKSNWKQARSRALEVEDILE